MPPSRKSRVDIGFKPPQEPKPDKARKKGFDPEPDESFMRDAPPRRVRWWRWLARLVIVLAVCGALGYVFRHELLRFVAHNYPSLLASIFNDPENEARRAALIEILVEDHRDTPIGLSLPLRDDKGRVNGRFRIDRARIERPENLDTPEQRRTYTVFLTGNGELWHEIAGRLRFRATAIVTYTLDFELDHELPNAYVYFAPVNIAHVQFDAYYIEDDGIDWVFTRFVNEFGTDALDEALRPGFTIIAELGGESWSALGRAGREFKPREGTFARESGTDDLANDTVVLRRNYREFVGPFEIDAGRELRVTVDATDDQGQVVPGVDVLLLTEGEFERYESAYRDHFSRMEGKLDLTTVHEQWMTRDLRFTRSDLQGKYFLVIDRTRFGKGNQGADSDKRPFIVRYHVRLKH